MTKIDMGALLDPFSDRKMNTKKIASFRAAMVRGFYANGSKEVGRWSFGNRSYKFELNRPAAEFAGSYSQFYQPGAAFQAQPGPGRPPELAPNGMLP